MQRTAAHLGDGTFDVIVIGGGISGAAVAYEAATRGLKTILFEKGDFGQATSAASSKLIHGGLRYLANLEVRLVRESLRERRILENIAPNFVYPLPMLFPHYRGQRHSNPWRIKVGLTFYDLLAYDKGRTWDPGKAIPDHTTLSAAEALQRQSVLRRTGLQGASIFYDCLNVCPERLTLAFVRAALAHGAQAANYTRVDEFLMDPAGARVLGVTVQDRFQGDRRRVRGRIVLNCTGPWIDHVLALTGRREAQRPLRRSEGIHIITRPLINDRCAVSAVTPNGRHCFLIPWRGHTLVGTTDQPYAGHPDDYRVTRRSIEELIAEVNAAFGKAAIRYDDVRHCYGGLRPLVATRTGETYRASRKYEIHDHGREGLAGLITVEGGKWTTSRHLAEKVIDHLWYVTDLPIDRSLSAHRYLEDCRIRDAAAFIRGIVRENPDFEADTAAYLGRLYGTAYGGILALARQRPELARPLNDQGDILAQAVYAARREMVATLEDIVLRRTGIATLGNPGRHVLQLVAETVAADLGWDAARIEQEVDRTVAALAIPEH